MFFLIPNQILNAEEVIVPKLFLNKYEIDYCSDIDKEKEFIITLDLGEIFYSDSLYDVDLVFAYDKKKVVILAPLLIGTLSEYFQATTNSVWDNLSYKYNYYNFQGYRLTPVYGKRPLIKFVGKILVDSIDTTDFSIGYINLSEEFSRKYIQSNDDTIKLYSKPKSNSKNLVKLVLNDSIYQNEIEISNKNSTAEVPCDLILENPKYFENFKIKFTLKRENDGIDDGSNNKKNSIDDLDNIVDIRITDFVVDDRFTYSVIERSDTDLLLNLTVNHAITSNKIIDFCDIKIEKEKYSEHSGVMFLSIDIFDINESSCSSLVEGATALKINSVYKSDTTGIIDKQENNKINNIDYGFYNNTLLVNSSKEIKKIKIMDILGRVIYDLNGTELIDKYNIKKQLDLRDNCIYLLEILQENNILRTKMIIN